MEDFLDYPELTTKKRLIIDSKAGQDWRRSQKESQARLDEHRDFYNRFKMKQRTMLF